MELFRQSLARCGGRISRWALLSGCVAVASLVVPAQAQVPGAHATPFQAWPEPKIDPNLTVDQAKALVAERTRPQTEWKGPTTGPKAPKQELTLAWVSGDELLHVVHLLG